jgi:biopolymer transport protein ExbB
LFIAIAPSLGFLGTVIGMIQAFDNIQRYGDISPDIISGGMKIALITTVAGLIVAVILQLFYNYILNKIEGIVNDMEGDSILILDIISKYKRERHSQSVETPTRPTVSSGYSIQEFTNAGFDAF